VGGRGRGGGDRGRTAVDSEHSRRGLLGVQAQALSVSLRIVVDLCERADRAGKRPRTIGAAAPESVPTVSTKAASS
jgi:hypothetical protein